MGSRARKERERNRLQCEIKQEINDSVSIKEYKEDVINISKSFSFTQLNSSESNSSDYLTISELKKKNIKISVVVIVYNRFENIVEWIRIWKMCEQLNSQLTIIHNYDKIEECIRYKAICMQNGINYILRKNIGFDIAAFQDVCLERLNGFNNEWDFLFWATDDTIPVRRDFLFQYAKILLDDSVGISCMHISDEVREHIRTTGFCIKKQVSRKLDFLSTIKSKNDCYEFEHRSHRNLLSQVKRMNFKAIMPVPLKDSYVWDKGYWDISLRAKNINPPSRLLECIYNFSSKSKYEGRQIIFICPVFNSFPEIVSSLLCQTYKNWQLLLIHDGKNTTNLNKYINDINDERIIYMETEKRAGNWGHSLRDLGLTAIKNSSNGHYVVITNADNYHVPVYCEYMLKAFDNNENIIATYCDRMIHSYQSWNIQECRLELGHIDCAGVMIKKEIACEIGWKDMTHSSDWTYFNNIIQKYGSDYFKKVNGCLLVHN